MSIADAHGEIQERTATLDTDKCCVHLTIPFTTNQLATVAKNSIDADEVPNPELIKRVIEVEESKLKVSIECEDLFKLRTSLNNFIEAVLQVQKTIQRFDFDKNGLH